MYKYEEGVGTTDWRMSRYSPVCPLMEDIALLQSHAVLGLEHSWAGLSDNPLSRSDSFSEALFSLI